MNTTLRNDALTAFLNLLPSGSILTLYSGTVPADANAALGSATALAAHTMTGWNAPSNGVATAQAVPNATISATGTPTFARITSGSRVLQLTAGAGGSGANVIYSNANYQSGGTSQITSVTVTQGV